MKKIILFLSILLCFSGFIRSAEAQRQGRMGVLVYDPNASDWVFTQDLVFSNTSVDMGDSADVTVDLGTAGGWLYDSANGDVTTTHLVGINDTTPDGQLDITNGAAARIALDIDGAAAQSANIVDVDDATGDALFTIENSGDVGIGTNAPGYILDILDPTGGGGVKTFIQMDISSTTTNDGAAIDFRTSTNDLANRYVARISGTRSSLAGSELAFSTDNGSTLSEAMRIDDSGNVGIGTTAPGVTLEVDGVIRTTSAEWYACKYINGFSVDPGASGATFTAPDSDTLGGFNLDADGEFLYFNAKICSDWDGSSDVIIRVFWEVDDADATGDAVIDVVAYMKGDGETSTKSQSLSDTEDCTGDAQYTQHYSDFTIDYDDGSNGLDSGDNLTCKLNFDATSSDISDIIYNYAIILYQTKKVNIEIP